MITDYIWDFDGTLFNSYPHISQAMYETLILSGRYCTPDKVYNSMCITYKNAFDEYNLTDSEKDIFYSKESDFNFYPPVIPFMGIENILKNIVSRGCRNYIYTHSPASKIHHYLSEYNIVELFTEVVDSHHDYFVSKPSGDSIEYLVNKHSLTPANTMMIGDRRMDVLSGKNAGILGCYITNHRDYYCPEADIVVDDLSEFSRRVLGNE